MSFFVDEFFDELEKGSLKEAELLAEKWDEIFQRKELWQKAEVVEVEKSSGEGNSESEDESSQENAAGFREKTREASEACGMSDDDLKVAVAATMLKDTVFSLLDWWNGKDSSAFKSGDAQIAVAGTEEDNIEVCYKKGNAELAFCFNGDDLDIDEMDDVDDAYDTGIYIFQKLCMALRIGGRTEIEFLRIRKKDRHAVRENDITLTEFLDRFAPYYGFTGFPESFAEHALRFMQRLMKVAYADRQRKREAEEAEQEKAEAEREKNEEEELRRKEEMLADI